MIIDVTQAILHVLDGNSGVTVFSDIELDMTDPAIFAFISKHIEKIYDDPALRSGEFNKTSTFQYHLKEYLNGNIPFQKFSLFIAEHIYEGISQCEKTESADLIVCRCTAGDTPLFAVLKCDNKIGYTHQVLQEDGKIQNLLINHYAILPSMSQKITECAFINTEDFSIRYLGKKRVIDGEAQDLMADILLDCIYDISAKESITKVNKIAKKVAEENGSDTIEAAAKLKEYVTQNTTEAENEYIDTRALAGAVFDQSAAMREEFIEKITDAQVPEQVPMNDYIAKKINSNIKISTDIGVELSFPAEYYRDSDYVEFVNNEDGTISIRINNIGEIVNK